MLRSSGAMGTPPFLSPAPWRRLRLVGVGAKDARPFRWSFLAAAASSLQSASAAGFHRPPVARSLVEELYLGSDPFDFPPPPTEIPSKKNMTHVKSFDIDMVLEFAPQPVTFYVELGAFEGGSAILAASRAWHRVTGGAAAAPPDATGEISIGGDAAAAVESVTTILAVDTFLGDNGLIWLRDPVRKKELLRPDGSVNLWDRFRTNVLRSGYAGLVLPLQATSVTALRLLPKLAAKGVAPLPQVIYLDSAHEADEVFLELTLAWKALAPGGIIFGDDWCFLDVRRDVMRFAKAEAEELHDYFEPFVRGDATIARVRKGVFISYRSSQWFISKPRDADQRAAAKAAAETGGGRPEQLGFECWSEAFGPGDCCDVAKFGHGGNPKCWDMFFSFEQCC